MMIEVFKANPENRDSAVAEFHATRDGTVDIPAEVFRQDGKFMIALFAQTGGVQWEFPVSDFVEAIEAGKALLQ
jgi:hypothetical protein